MRSSSNVGANPAVQGTLRPVQGTLRPVRYCVIAREFETLDWTQVHVVEWF